MFSIEKMYILPDAGTLKAFADVRYHDIIIKGVRVLNGTKGLFVSMPAEQGKDNKWYDQVVCKDAATYDALAQCVLSYYKTTSTTSTADIWTNAG